MNCHDARRAMLEEGPGAARAHLATCADCRRLADAIEDVDSRVRRMVDDYEQRPLQAAWTQARETGHSRRWSMVQGGLIGLAAAAALMVAVAGTQRAEGPPSEPPSAAASADVAAAVLATASTPWGALSEQDWALRANELLRLDAAVPAGDAALRFALYAQIGRAAENANAAAPPFYGPAEVDGAERRVNLYWWKAAEIGSRHPELYERVAAEVAANIRHYEPKR